jgi:hypothetical protein
LTVTPGGVIVYVNVVDDIAHRARSDIIDGGTARMSAVPGRHAACVTSVQYQTPYATTTSHGYLDRSSPHPDRSARRGFVDEVVWLAEEFLFIEKLSGAPLPTVTNCWLNFGAVDY